MFLLVAIFPLFFEGEISPREEEYNRKEMSKNTHVLNFFKKIIFLIFLLQICEERCLPY